MRNSTAITLEKGGIVCLPDDILTRHGWTEGTRLVAISSQLGLLLVEQSAIEQSVRGQLSGHDLLGELVADRRREAELESA